MSVGAVLLDILIVLVAAKAAAEIAERIGIPGVVAEIPAGMIVGPSVLGAVGTNETLEVLGEIGVLLLLLQVGLEMDLRELGAVGRASMSVAVIGVIVPMVGGFGAAELLSYDSNTALFLGAALAATSVGITARVFSDLRALGTIEARTVLGAAVADDVMGLVILTVVVRIVSEGTISVLSLVGILAVAIGFLAIAVTIGSRFGPPLFEAVHRRARSAGTLVALALAFTLAFAELADAAKLAPIVGAFVAGVALSRSSVKDRVERELAPVGHLFIPVFFLQIGIAVDVGQFASPKVLGIAGLLIVVAVLGKLVAAFGMMRAPGDKWLVGLGMLPRGEVGLIFATIGLREGVLGRDLYAALLLVVLVTTMIAPPLVRARLQRIRSRGVPDVMADPMPASGWLATHDDIVDLAATPPSAEAVHVALDAARLVAAGARPGARLLDWLGALGTGPLRWDAASTVSLIGLLEETHPRAWRFLETTGVLERALPELSHALSRRRADPFVLDPAHVLSFPSVDRLAEALADDRGASVVYAQLAHPERLVLATLVLDAVGDDRGAVDMARSLTDRLGLDAAAEEALALLVGGSTMLRAGAARLDGLDEERVLQVASHLRTVEHARALYVLSVAQGGLEVWERERLDALLEVVVAALADEDLTGTATRDLVEQRREDALRLAGRRVLVADRVLHAPQGYLLTEPAEVVVRHAQLLESLPGRSEVRVDTTPAGADAWTVDIAMRDRPGLLATVTGALADEGLDVIDATVATWGDGAALETFLVRQVPSSPDPTPTPTQTQTPTPNGNGNGNGIEFAIDRQALAAAIKARLGRSFVSDPIDGAVITFDDDASPWYTLCEMRVPDRPGLLHAITAGLCAAGVDVHSARLHSEAGSAIDHFELTDRSGRKVDVDLRLAIERTIAHGVGPRSVFAAIGGRRVVGRRG